MNKRSTNSRDAHTYFASGRTEEAEDVYRQGLAILQDLAARHPRVPGYRSRLANGYFRLGKLCKEQGRTQKAEENYRQVLAICRKLMGEAPRVPDHQNILAEAHRNLGNLFHDAGRTKEAEQAYRQAVAVWSRLGSNHPDGTAFALNRAAIHVKLADLLNASARSEQAVQSCDRALATLEPVLQKDPRHTGARQTLRNAHLLRAVARSNLGRYREAYRDWAEAMKLDPSKNQAFLQLQMAYSQAREGEHAAAAAHARQAEQPDPATGSGLYTLASVYALLAGAVGKDQQLSDVQRGKLADHYTARALDLLEKARTAGHFDDRNNRKLLKSDSDLNPLRKNLAFQALVADIE